MPPELSSPRAIVSRIRELLGLTPDDADSELSMLSLEALLRLTRRQLLDAARYLGLTEVGRLTKDALARQFLQMFRSLERSAALETQESGDGSRKFDLGRAMEAVVEAEGIPWGYGQDRVTTMVVDPERLYVYWEVTDEAIERARAGLGPSGQDAWLNLRVYDVTNRIFDGTNAHGYFDQSVSRTDRQWFFLIGKPTSTAIVELGLKSQEGYFVRLARSGRANFPRVEPVSPGGVEWLMVHAATGEVGEPAADSRTPAAVHHAPGLTAHVEPVRAWDIRRTHAGAADGEWILRDESFGNGWESMFDWVGAHQLEWEGPLIRTSWDAGPFPYPVEPSPYIEERFGGTVTVRSVDGRTHIVYGPWHVVIRGLGARAERKVLAIWETYRSWVVQTGAAAHLPMRGARTPGGSEQIALGASERHRRAASELRLGGASEVYRLGASELRYLGASETLYSGASEWRLQGASERRFLGASQWLSGGASELRSAGASEHRLGGASESVLGYPADRQTTRTESVLPKR